MRRQNSAAIYLRLSRDDGGDAESNSIQNQRTLLQNYALEHGFRVFAEYVDDGISGTTFERSGFKKMISDIEEGHIGVLICKDLSRLGRHNAMVSYYTEIFFFEHDVRFICVNDGIDTAHGDNEILPFKSVINEYYARDISKKIKSVVTINAKQGKRIGGQPPFGYMLDPHDKHHFVINPKTAPTVKRIFEMSVDSKSCHAIARTLTAEKIPTPRDTQHGTYSGVEWTATSVHALLKNKVYLGCMVAQKSCKPSFKSNRIIQNDKSDWVEVDGTHDPIIDTEVFELVQRRISIKKRKNTYKLENVFAGVVKCSDCGSTMGMTRNGGDIVYLVCSNYRRLTKDKCSAHRIQYKNLSELVIEGICENAVTAKTNEHRIDDFIRESLAEISAKNRKADNALLAKLKRREDEIDRIIKRLFEEIVLGDMPRERFYRLSDEYEVEREEVVSRIEQIKSKFEQEAGMASNYRQFFELMKNYTNLRELNTTIITNVVNQIVVHESDGRGANRTQRVEVHYRLVDEGLVKSLNI
jgi:DNA invertase Pin-like site-specific DNA recombinase